MVNELRSKFREAVSLEEEALNLCARVLNLRVKAKFACQRLESLAIRLEHRRFRRRDKQRLAYAKLQSFYFDREKAGLDKFNAQRVTQ